MAGIAGGASPGTAHRWPTPDGFEGKDHTGKLGAGGEFEKYVNNWPTPVAHDDNKTPEAHLAMKARMPGGPRSAITSLQVLAKDWATPSASPWHSGDASDETMARNARPLNEQASHWQTPSVADTMGGHLSRGGKGQAKAVSAFISGPPVHPTETDGPPSSLGGRTLRPQLSALFVEWLMGLPLGWTCVCAIEVTD